MALKKSNTKTEKNDSRNVASNLDSQYALSRMSTLFRIGIGFILTAFQDNGKNCKVTVDSDRYQVTVVFKDPTSEGFPSYNHALDSVPEEDE